MGGDKKQRNITKNSMGFNPRPRMGGDILVLSSPGEILGFNPRPRMGGDHRHCWPLRSGGWFQSTPPHGGRRKVSRCSGRG